MEKAAGSVCQVVGPVVQVEMLGPLKMLDMVEIGNQRLVGEVVRLKENRAFVQVYEDTTSIKAGDPIFSQGVPLSLELGPGLIGTIFDGIQRPLDAIREKQGFFVRRGVHVSPLDRSKKWHFVPQKHKGDRVNPGDTLGEVQETQIVSHKIMVPPDFPGGILERIAPPGDYTIEEVIAWIGTKDGLHELRMYQKWPVRKPRPYQERLEATEPLITGQRVIDTLFPVTKGGCVAIPGGFGTGKTVVEHQLAKWSNADIVIFVGCGERGNEMTDVLLNFPRLIDPRTKRPLTERTLFVANTSNMPVAAREASIYTGITMAEYYRDMGYQVALMADSTSRWAEALRELSGRLEEIPLEEGFPSYLPARLAEFYERAGRVRTLGGNQGSITIIASVSPPGGDFSEPVTSHTKRFIRCFWALDKDLAYSRHYPAISWLDSYSEYVNEVSGWWDKTTGEEWLPLRYMMMDLLQKEQRLQQVVKLVGPDVLPDTQKLILEICAMFKNAFLQQSAFDEIDTYSSARKQFLMLKAIVSFYRAAEQLVKQGVGLSEVRASPVYQDILRMKTRYTEDRLDELEKTVADIDKSLKNLEV